MKNLCEWCIPAVFKKCFSWKLQGGPKTLRDCFCHAGIVVMMNAVVTIVWWYTVQQKETEGLLVWISVYARDHYWVHCFVTVVCNLWRLLWNDEKVCLTWRGYMWSGWVDDLILTESEQSICEKTPKWQLATVNCEDEHCTNKGNANAHGCTRTDRTEKALQWL